MMFFFAPKTEVMIPALDMDKRVSLSRSFSPQFGVGSKGEKPIAAVGASESKRLIKRKHFVPFSFLLYLRAPFSSSLCLFLPAQ